MREKRGETYIWKKSGGIWKAKRDKRKKEKKTTWAVFHLKNMNVNEHVKERKHNSWRMKRLPSGGRGVPNQHKSSQNHFIRMEKCFQWRLIFWGWHGGRKCSKNTPSALRHNGVSGVGGGTHTLWESKSFQEAHKVKAKWRAVNFRQFQKKQLGCKAIFSLLIVSSY